MVRKPNGFGGFVINSLRNGTGNYFSGTGNSYSVTGNFPSQIANHYRMRFSVRIGVRDAIPFNR
jgi:hypothetical protein